ncbi:hypothetical protein ACMXYO_07545 [Neptuniibacter sp. QD37_6]|uniref:hypothetical protein n=1 Tax=Neptuniibacter sp. QD37_6 TaxID=3398210 RepID=UPI0039F64046
MKRIYLEAKSSASNCDVVGFPEKVEAYRDSTYSLTLEIEESKCRVVGGFNIYINDKLFPMKVIDNVPFLNHILTIWIKPNIPSQGLVITAEAPFCSNCTIHGYFSGRRIFVARAKGISWKRKLNFSGKDEIDNLLGKNFTSFLALFCWSLIYN